MHSYQVRVYIATWNALPNWYSDFPSSLTKAKEQLGKFNNVSIWEREGDSNNPRIVWSSDFGGINEFKKFGGLSDTCQKVFDFYKSQKQLGRVPDHQEIAEYAKVERYKISRILGKLCWAGYLTKNPEFPQKGKYEIA